MPPPSRLSTPVSGSLSLSNSRGTGDFWASLVSVQQENGRILQYISILGALNLGLALALARLPAPDTYLVEGAATVSTTPIYWNQSDTVIQTLIGDIPGSSAPRSSQRSPTSSGPVAPQ